MLQTQSKLPYSYVPLVKGAGRCCRDFALSRVLASPVGPHRPCPACAGQQTHSTKGFQALNPPSPPTSITVPCSPYERQTRLGRRRVKRGRVVERSDGFGHSSRLMHVPDAVHFHKGATPVRPIPAEILTHDTSVHLHHRRRLVFLQSYSYRHCEWNISGQRHQLENPRTLHVM